ncbi:wolframin-like [Saccostrea echinata]|uniref:wolframin-like n=1 Tax=Saccostrea echinata TaxID=191078 RepID=UPI002A806315|nr:wolframin-like [Saccostrea echinata]
MAEGDSSGSVENIQKWEKLASDGDEASQVRLGEHYLKLADSGSEEDRQKYGKVAVTWLIEASKQGNEKADELLNKCLQTKTGVDDSNREVIDWCLETSDVEKKIRRAAKNMFRAINGTQREVLSRADYIESVKKLAGGDKLEEKLLLAAGKKIGDTISETEFVKVLSKKIQGQITLSPDEMGEGSVEYKHAGLYEKVTRYPKETAVALYETGLEYVSKEGLDFVMKMIPTNQIYLLSVFFLYSFISAALIFQVVPLVIFYLTLGVMGVTTLQMFYKKRKLKEASKLADVLKTYDVGVDVEQTKSQFTWNSLTPYLVFFGALPLMVVSFSLANKSYVPCSEICVLCGALSAVCFVALSDHYDLLTLLSLFCNLLSALPTFFHHFPQIPVFTTLLHIFTDAIFTIDCGSGFKIHFGIPSIAFLLIPLIFVVMAAQKSWKGVYRVLVPHLVCYFWFNLMLSFFPFSSWKGLIRATLGYFLLPFLIPLALLLIAGGIIYMFYSLLHTQIFGKLLITLIFAAVPLLMTQTKVFVGKKLESKMKPVKIAIMVVFGVLAILPLIFIRLPTTKSPKPFNMSFSEYMDFCGDNELDKSFKCLHLQGQKVTWNGEFARAEIKSVTNNIEPLLSAFPVFIANEIRCLYGQRFGDCDDVNKTESEHKLCRTMDDLGHECHLRNLDTYTFEVYITMPDYVTAELDAGHSFRETLSALQTNDKVEFTGTLIKDLGTRNPKLALRHITCTSRPLDLMMDLEEESVEEMVKRELNNAITVTFNFFWYPLVEYAP